MHTRQFSEAGQPLEKASKALIMIHGRGGNATDILSLKDDLFVDEFYIVAPQATNFTWYPYSFLAPIQQNEPWLSSAIELLDGIVNTIKSSISTDKIYLLGFSQGACLTLEYATRHAQKWGGVVAFTGGLIGDKINSNNYKGNFEGTKVFIGNSDDDPHVPADRSKESEKIMDGLGANVTLKIYPNMTHTIVEDEIKIVNDLFFNVNKHRERL